MTAKKGVTTKKGDRQGKLFDIGPSVAPPELVCRPRGWERLLKLKGTARAAAFSERFRNELGYKSVQPWPIHEKKSGGKIMYFMIHATDHPDAPTLMSRAYRKGVLTDAEFEQLALELDLRPAGS